MAIIVRTVQCPSHNGPFTMAFAEGDNREEVVCKDCKAGLEAAHGISEQQAKNNNELLKEYERRFGRL